MTNVTAATVTRSRALAQLDLRRRRAKVTHDQIAARAEVHRTYVVHYFAGRRTPKYDVIRPATEALCAAAEAKRAKKAKRAA